jgi:hypothetical protein
VGGLDGWQARDLAGAIGTRLAAGMLDRADHVGGADLPGARHGDAGPGNGRCRLGGRRGRNSRTGYPLGQRFGLCPVFVRQRRRRRSGQVFGGLVDRVGVVEPDRGGRRRGDRGG